MGAVRFSLDPELLRCLTGVLPLEVFVETGTFQGDTVQSALPFFKEVHSVELSPAYYAGCRARFEKHPAVTLYHGPSPECLHSLRDRLAGRSALYWLDAHWCQADQTSGFQAQCPLLEELAAVGRLNETSLVLIDDARLFLAPPLGLHDVGQWPVLGQVLDGLKALSGRHEVMVLNDVILYYPLAARGAVLDYARRCGFDWLTAADKQRDYDLLLEQLIEKDALIHKLSERLRKKNYLRVRLGEIWRKVFRRAG